MNREQARLTLSRECERLGLPPPSSFTTNKCSRPTARNEQYWLSRLKLNEDANKPRSRAYLRAYNQMVNVMYASGFLLDDCYLHPDKSVIKRFLHERFLTLKDGIFCLTEKGRNFVLR